MTIRRTNSCNQVENMTIEKDGFGSKSRWCHSQIGTKSTNSTGEQQSGERRGKRAQIIFIYFNHNTNVEYSR